MSKTAFLFPGQASQYVGMGNDLYNKIDDCRKLYDLADEIFDFSLINISFNGPLTELTKTKVTQPAIFVHSVAIFQELEKKGYLPNVVAGHSLGEYSALVAAGVLSFEAGLKLVKIRSEEMQAATENSEGTMAAIIGLDYNEILAVMQNSGIPGICQIANYNSQQQIVISGEVAAVQSMMMELKEHGAKRAIELPVGGAFHSPLMESARLRLQEALNETDFNKPKYPIYSNVTGTATSEPEEIKNRLNEQLTEPVLWVDTIENMVREGVVNFVEVGPGNVLQGLVRRINNQISTSGIATFEDLEKIS
ncbi:MAG: ACP S-malonyltransferase [Candidatus Marinimicrobia bacterium]|nr:ACP S-malonyltransferase [Candidatus Neomarinimicrobiota bacterium]